MPGGVERRLLAQFRPSDRQENRQPPPAELIEEDRQVIPEARQETSPPDYQTIRDRVLKSLITGRGRIAPSAPQYKSAVKVLDRFIAEIQGDAKT
ncbi:hypothetical protein [Nostoc sp.]|uniref:hypothetical protein n=1 Tax=Nostoc sp. TaxID=1180 RepID=UPI002FF53FE5